MEKTLVLKMVTSLAATGQYTHAQLYDAIDLLLGYAPLGDRWDIARALEVTPGDATVYQSYHIPQPAFGRI